MPALCEFLAMIPVICACTVGCKSLGDLQRVADQRKTALQRHLLRCSMVFRILATASAMSSGNGTLPETDL